MSGRPHQLERLLLLKSDDGLDIRIHNDFILGALALAEELEKRAEEREQITCRAEDGTIVSTLTEKVIRLADLHKLIGKG